MPLLHSVSQREEQVGVAGGGSGGLDVAQKVDLEGRGSGDPGMTSVQEVAHR